MLTFYHSAVNTETRELLILATNKQKCKPLVCESDFFLGGGVDEGVLLKLNVER